MEIRYRPCAALVKVIRTINSCINLAQLDIAYSYNNNYRQLYPAEYTTHDQNNIYQIYLRKFNELKPKEDNNESNS